MGTNPGESGGHEVFTTTDGGNTCSTDSMTANGDFPDGSTWTGNGKLYYDHTFRKLVVPITFTKGGNLVGLGVATATPGGQFTPFRAADTPSGVFAHWPAIALDSDHNLYEVWDTNERSTTADGGCGTLPPPGPDSGPAPLPNTVQYAVSTDLGKTWSPPAIVARGDGNRVFWPWIAAGAPGRISLVWYRTDKLTDPDCQESTISVNEAQVFNAFKPDQAQVTVVDPVKRPIHTGTVCQGGTTCVATGQDRRLGDFLTNGIDANGCVLVATGDTTRPDPVSGGPRPISLPLFIAQNSGPSLTGGDCAAPSSGLAFGPAGVTAACRDRTPPTSRFRRGGLRPGRRTMRFRGFAADRGCRNAAARVSVAGHVSRVRIAIARVISLGRCRFLHRNGTFGRTRSCRVRSFLAARGRGTWSFAVRGRFPRGTYRVRTQAIDRAGNVQRVNRRHPYTTFHVR
jgi:hypothetical protein